MSCLYILDINPLSVALFSRMFFTILRAVCSFCYAFLLPRSHWIIFVFIFITLEGRSKRSCCKLCQRVFYLFWSLIHFEFIFVYGVRKCSNWITLHVVVQFSQHHLLKRLSFLHCVFLLCHRLGDHRCVGLTLDFLSLHWSVFLILCVFLHISVFVCMFWLL